MPNIKTVELFATCIIIILVHHIRSAAHIDYFSIRFKFHSTVVATATANSAVVVVVVVNFHVDDGITNEPRMRGTSFFF